MKQSRMNLSIPTELKDRMEERAGEFNWSKVARMAFEMVLEDRLFFASDGKLKIINPSNAGSPSLVEIAE